ncbi:hypothetical protein ACFFLS_18305 [Flavobacterium procerum]|uniref:DUF4625 domain-containing protein n=1 Tax=Flavobacterium procerum TaxID=1455569 RepID=A0ABV6BWE4_9FLAO
MKKSIFGLLVLALTSCNPVGENLGETALSDEGISSIENLDLKKGDEVVFWSKMATRKDSTFSKLKVKYSISCNNKIIEFDSLYIAEGNHTINSKTEMSEVTHFTSTGKDSIVYVKNWEFEIENQSFKIPQDGKYNFDFKLDTREVDFTAKNNTSAALIIRKK